MFLYFNNFFFLYYTRKQIKSLSTFILKTNEYRILNFQWPKMAFEIIKNIYKTALVQC